MSGGGGEQQQEDEKYSELRSQRLMKFAEEGQPLDVSEESVGAPFSTTAAASGGDPQKTPFPAKKCAERVRQCQPRAGDTLVALVSCGSFSPPSLMHLRMFEMAADAVELNGLCRDPDHCGDPATARTVCIGGFLSPVNDAYGKSSLVDAEHRVRMCERSVESSDLIAVDTWECKQAEYFPSLPVLVHFRTNVRNIVAQSLPEGVSIDDVNVQVLMLCGTDLLESFNTPGVWAAQDIRDIVGQFGLVCIERDGTDGAKMVFENDVLYEHRHNIEFVRQWIPNDLSSTKIRQFARRGMSMKYLAADGVIEYIYEHGLYGASRRNAHANL